MKKLTRLLLKNNQPLNSTTLATYEIKEDELIFGVCYPTCFHLPMERSKGKWYCTSCSTYSTSAHITALQDYELLLRPTITNKHLRSFLKLPSRNIATNLLKSMNLSNSGEKKGRKYKLSFFD